jgi:hypothetical protein
VEVADTGIPAAAAADGTQAADALEILLQHGGIVIEVTAAPASALTRSFLFAGMHPSRKSHDENGYETHRRTAGIQFLSLAEDREKIRRCQRKRCRRA